MTGELRNSISGKGIVSATASTDVELDGDNSRFVGQFNIDAGSALSVNEQKNTGDASVINNGLLTIATERSWAMTHSISGSGDVTKLGTGILTLNKDSAAYQGYDGYRGVVKLLSVPTLPLIWQVSTLISITAV